MTGLLLAALLAASPHDALTKLVDDYDTFDRQTDPISAGQEGDREALSRWPDDSPAALAEQAKTLQSLKMRLVAIPASGLGADDALNRALLVVILDDRLEELALDTARMPFTDQDGFWTYPNYLGHVTAIHDRFEADAWLARLAGIPHFYDVEIANARRGMATGFTQHKTTVEATLVSAREMAKVEPEKSALILPLEKLPSSIPAKEQAELRAKALALVRDGVLPAQRAFVRFLETEYLPKARASLAIRDVPNGEAVYAHAIRHYTTTNRSPDELFDLGQSEVKRIRAEMDQAMAAAGFHGTFAEFQKFLHTEPRFYARTREELLEKASEIAKRIDDTLPREFGTLPRLTYGVRPVPREIEETYTTGRYFEGSPAQGQAGGLMINTSHLDQRPLYELPALVLHEGVPGHHLQIALAQELHDLPAFRRHGDFTAFVEGWGLYSEQLGVELGIYRDPYEQFGRLSYEMWRACRLIADSGIHWKRWTREQARACFAENTALSPKNIDVELDRYIAWPGQALAYKVGELELMRLRHHAEEKLGSRFDVRRFHDAVLLQGALPMELLAQRVDAWIAEELKRPTAGP
ncbi:MAG: DUF885 family protein [Deltaproteobacteria bacterium]|nr:DUF885 family protein [Deltaproteobacteria bacterium]